MNRKTFLLKTFYTCSALWFGQDILQTCSAFANAVDDDSANKVKIKETNLQFSTLEHRLKTNLIVIHHVGGIDDDVSAATIHKWHLANGWAGIGYHYVIRKDGTIERGRPVDAIGAHTYGYNKTSIGINLVGNFEVSIPKPEQIESAACLIANLCNKYKLTPNKSTVRGHRDFNATLCPGQNLYSKLQDIRRKAYIYV